MRWLRQEGGSWHRKRKRRGGKEKEGKGRERKGWLVHRAGFVDGDGLEATWLWTWQEGCEHRVIIAVTVGKGKQDGNFWCDGKL